MRTKILMSVSATLMAAAGVSLTFLPAEILDRYGGAGRREAVFLLQALGALYLGFASLNWSARGNLLGGIYGRPVVAGNFVYFAIAAVTIAKAVPTGSAVLLIALAIHGPLAAWFGLVLFGGSPVPGRDRPGSDGGQGSAERQ